MQQVNLQGLNLEIPEAGADAIDTRGSLDDIDNNVAGVNVGNNLTTDERLRRETLARILTAIAERQGRLEAAPQHADFRLSQFPYRALALIAEMLADIPSPRRSFDSPTP
jgi:hypothetical protein